MNDASGANDEETQTQLESCCSEAGFFVERTVRIADEELPVPAALDRAGIELIAVFAGDGTVNTQLDRLAGWAGAVLVLPGGTMNLLSHRLHGDRTFENVIRPVAAGEAAAVRPKVIAGRTGIAYADVLAGPGASWYDVREAMREADVAALADSAAQAIGHTLAAPGIVCRQPNLGRTEGYPLIMLTPTDAGMKVAGFHAETFQEYFTGSWALLRRRFREGPHDVLGIVDQVTLASTDSTPFGILLDGEKTESPGSEVFRLVPCPVDLLATRSDGR